jgi:hypothetical protein
VSLASNDASNILSALNSDVPGGATPTAATLAMLPQLFASPSSSVVPDRYVILLTDGMPNCDPNIQATESNCGGDRCTGGICNDWSICGCNPASGGDVRLCLDESDSVSAVSTLYQQGIRTFVLGFGADTDGPVAQEVLGAMAQAGGLVVTEQGGGQGGTYYQANSASDLNQALQNMGSRMASSCRFQLGSTAPTQTSKAVVNLNGTNQTLQSSQYQVDQGGQSVVVTDSTLCSELRQASSLQFQFTP